MKPKTPWLVKERDLRRYLGRALGACKSGRVVFFYRTYEGSPQLMALSPYPDDDDVLPAARDAMANGRYRKVVLQNLPRKKR